MARMRGHCLCGACRFAYTGPENWRGHCHCESCRRQTASAFTTFMGVPHGAWVWEGETPRVYSSSTGVKRYFCGSCDAPMAYESMRFPDEIHFYAALLDAPESFAPQAHFHYSERLGWIQLADDLPKKG